MSSTFANGWFPLGHNWPFKREVRRVDVYSADYSDNEEDEGADDRDVLKETREMSWNTILQQVEDDIPAWKKKAMESYEEIKKLKEIHFPSIPQYVPQPEPEPDTNVYRSYGLFPATKTRW